MNGQEAAVIMSDKDINLVARLLDVELEGVALALTHRVTVWSLFCISNIRCSLLCNH